MDYDETMDRKWIMENDEHDINNPSESHGKSFAGLCHEFSVV